VGHQPVAATVVLPHKEVLQRLQAQVLVGPNVCDKQSHDAPLRHVNTPVHQYRQSALAPQRARKFAPPARNIWSSGYARASFALGSSAVLRGSMGPTGVSSITILPSVHARITYERSTSLPYT
jgi:hypothetical protein